MDVGDLSSPAGLAGRGSISGATGVGVIANTTSATSGWWTPTSTITSATANTDVVSSSRLLSFPTAFLPVVSCRKKLVFRPIFWSVSK